MALAFSVGDTVVLKSGGPVMTVREVVADVGEGRTTVTCCFFDGCDHGGWRMMDDIVLPADAVIAVDPNCCRQCGQPCEGDEEGGDGDEWKNGPPDDHKDEDD